VRFARRETSASLLSARDEHPEEPAAGPVAFGKPGACGRHQERLTAGAPNGDEPRIAAIAGKERNLRVFTGQLTVRELGSLQGYCIG
jgi:hypothetical protein